MNQRFLSITTLFLGLSLFFFSSCTNPIDSGAGLLQNDRVDVGFTDTLSLRMETVVADSILTYAASINSQLRDYLFGKMQDDFFGTTEASLYVTPLLLINQSGLYEEFIYSGNSQIDSIVLVLPLDSSGVYGDVSDPFDIEVYRLNERVEYGDLNVSYFSNTSFLTDPTPLVSATIQPSFDSMFVTKLIVERGTDTVTIGRHLRITLPSTLGDEFFAQDSTVFLRDSTFVDFFNGLYIKPTSVNNGMLDFNLFNKRWGGMYFYYTDQDTTYEYVFPVGGLSGKISRYEHDYTGSHVGDFLNTPAKGDSLAFLQGLEGLYTKIDIPNIAKLEGKIINQAELEFQVATVDGYDPVLDSPAEQIIVFSRNSEGVLEIIDDVSISPNDLSLYFGGEVEENNGTFTYSMNVSIHLQRIVDGDAPAEIYLAMFPRAANPRRVILNGANTSSNPARLKVSFTDI